MLFVLVIFLNILKSAEAKSTATCPCPPAQQCKPDCLNVTDDQNHRLRRREAATEDADEFIDQRKCNSDQLKEVMLQVS
ncbi:unnamed protein product [Gongylonema pulchrum]|uniref:Secreted protein n=1 Tax=Gongylonema pulchrum TaxID=637853 RepID=A0A183D4U5_9BILA|nr:unnamed protein product [Gongylonema pulchrum]